jgi:hypothetical protein
MAHSQATSGCVETHLLWLTALREAATPIARGKLREEVVQVAS